MVKYILIGNNPNIDENTIEKLNINDDDYIILFNHCSPLKFKKIREHENKIVFIRRNHLKSYWGINEVIENFNIFKEIFPFSTNHKSEKHRETLNMILDKKIPENKEKIISKINFNNITFIQKILKKLTPPYNKKKVPTSGFIAYQYFKSIKKNMDNMVLVGFTLIYDNNICGGSECHDGFYEIEYYKNELNNNNLIKIDN
jgi:hypothetical protein